MGLLKRLLILILVVWTVVSLVTLLIELVPGDPAVAVLGEQATPEQFAQFREKHGLDRPPFFFSFPRDDNGARHFTWHGVDNRYVDYWRSLLQGDMGLSFRNDRPVKDLILERYPATIELAIAAMAVMVVTLTIVLFSVITNATFTNTIDNITTKIDISVYLKDGITTTQSDKLVNELKQLPNVAGVRYLTKEAALQEYKQQNAGNQSLLAAISETDNPLPATIKVKPRDLNKVQSIETFLTKPANAALQTPESPSYNGDRKAAIDKIAHATSILRKAGVIAVLLFTLISVLIIFNTIQMAIFNRRDELTIMRLLGASTWYIRGPFVVESIIYGILSAIISVLFVHALFVAASSTLQASSLGLLDINYAARYFSAHFWMLLTVQLGLGILIGAASSIVATRRYLKFKTVK